VFQIDPAKQQRDIREGEIQPYVVSVSDWEKMSVWDKIGRGTQDRFYPDISAVADRVRAIFDVHEKEVQTVGESEFLLQMNYEYMRESENPQPDMLRVTRYAAMEMLARGDADVYRLTRSGAEKLTPIDAVKSGVSWFKYNSEFAIKLGDLPGLQKWAERAATEIKRMLERSEHTKSYETEL
jgi:hypothetical protein